MADHRSSEVQYGLIMRQPGAGTFVAARRNARPVVADLSNALADLIEMGRSTRVRLLSFAFVHTAPLNYQEIWGGVFRQLPVD